MIDLTGSVRNIFKVKYTTISNLIFKLHCKFTVIIFLFATIAVTLKQYVGEHIKCASHTDMPLDLLETFCFIMATHTILKYYNITALQEGIASHPGIGPSGVTSNEETITHTYYQWVPFVLFGHLIMFYLPYFLWKNVEGGKLKRLAERLKANMASENQQDKITIREEITLNKSWSYYLVTFEIINLLNGILQVTIIHFFLGERFFSLGVHAIRCGFKRTITFLDYVFPKIARCVFRRHGIAGGTEIIDILCVLPLNAINEKIYVFLWFWFVFLLFCSALGLLYRLITMIFYSNSKFNDFVFPAMSLMVKDNKTEESFKFSEWLFLKYLSKNMDGLEFRQLVDLLVGTSESEKLQNSREETGTAENAQDTIQGSSTQVEVDVHQN